jgi:hypothetical protein
MTEDRILIRQLSALTYLEAAPILVKLRALEIEVALSDLPPKVKALRTHELDRYKELRSAAVFCHGMAQLAGAPVAFADHVAQDYDFVARWTADKPRYAMVQLKDVVSQKLKPDASVQAQIDKLRKYVAGGNLAVAIHVSQDMHFDPAALVIPKLSIASLWIFGAITPDESEWAIWGNFIEVSPAHVIGRRFHYPA